MYVRRLGIEGENEEKAAPGSGSSERFQFGTVMGWLYCMCMCDWTIQGRNYIYSSYHLQLLSTTDFRMLIVVMLLC